MKIIESWKRKRNNKDLSPDKLFNINQRLIRGQPLEQISTIEGIGYSTLKRRYPFEHQNQSRIFDFTFHQEMEFERVYNEIEGTFYTLTTTLLKGLIFKLAEINNVSYGFRNNIQTVSNFWVKNFCKQRGLLINTRYKKRYEQDITLQENQFCRFVQNLKYLLTTEMFSPDRIFNVDEIGIYIKPNTHPKIRIDTAKNPMDRIASTKLNESLITAVCCFNAAGGHVPPFIITPSQNHYSNICFDFPFEYHPRHSKKGVITNEIFLEWLKCFAEKVKPTKTKPVLLILDNLHIHCTIEIYFFCRKNHIRLCVVPLHAANLIHPLNHTFFPRVSKFFKKDQDIFVKNTHSTRHVIVNAAIIHLKQAIDQAIVMEKAQESFSMRGIHPFNMSAMKSELFGHYHVSLRVESQTPASNETPIILKFKKLSPFPDLPYPPKILNTANDSLFQKCRI